MILMKNDFSELPEDFDEDNSFMYLCMGCNGDASKEEHSCPYIIKKGLPEATCNCCEECTKLCKMRDW